MAETDDYLRALVEEIHSTTVATIAADGHPQTRIIDMMLWDDRGVYFLTARGKEFYRQLMEQGYVAISGVAHKKSVSLRGRVTNIGSEHLDEMFEANPYMKEIYPGDTRAALDVFRVHDAEGEFFDISDPSHVVRGSFAIGAAHVAEGGYAIGPACVGCGSCLEVCPQSCIDVSEAPAVIDQHRCLHCGACVEACPEGAIARRAPRVA